VPFLAGSALPSAPPAIYTYVDNNVAIGTTYYYVVEALGLGGSSAPSAQASASIPAPVLPSVPGPITVVVN
jgi:hypothetical protein